MWNSYCGRLISTGTSVGITTIGRLHHYTSGVGKITQEPRVPFSPMFAADVVSGLKLQFKKCFIALEANPKELSVLPHPLNVNGGSPTQPSVGINLLRGKLS